MKPSSPRTSSCARSTVDSGSSTGSSRSVTITVMVAPGGDTPIDGSDPARMVFVFRADAPAAVGALPRELASLHAFGLGLQDEMALAPYAIDDATDLLFEARARPRDALWLAADNLNALFWGLHDWAHSHNHGPFEERAANVAYWHQWPDEYDHLIQKWDEFLSA